MRSKLMSAIEDADKADKYATLAEQRPDDWVVDTKVEQIIADLEKRGQLPSGGELDLTIGNARVRMGGLHGWHFVAALAALAAVGGGVFLIWWAL